MNAALGNERVGRIQHNTSGRVLDLVVTVKSWSSSSSSSSAVGRSVVG